MFYHIISSCEVQLWGISQSERIRKVLAKVGDFHEISDEDEINSEQNILVLRADYLFEANVLQKLIQHQEGVLISSDASKKPAAIWLQLHKINDAKKYLSQQSENSAITSIPILTPHELTGGYDPRLRKYDLAHVVQINQNDQIIIENYLYDKSYKGITDLVTKWWWPLPARGVVRKCAQKNITPNMVTSLGWLLTIFSGFAFYFGEFLIGLLAAWVMTFLDTVDGKLARVTLQASKIGHIMDHGLDIVHPPIWYWCWALGLGLSQITFLHWTFPVMQWVWIMIAAYIGGRIFEGLFQLLFNDISIFCWQPIDSYHRLITARRNPCIIMLSVAVVLQIPEQGFVWVVLWTMLSTILLAIRFLYACLYRVIKGPLMSWVSHVDPDQKSPNLAVKLFTGYPAQKTIAPLL